jgi:hypothetical protein
MLKKIGVLVLTAALSLPAATGAMAQDLDRPVSAVPGTTVVEPVAADAIAAVKGDDELLEQAIKAAKQYLGNTDRFARLTHSISDYGKVKLVFLNWSESKKENEHLSAVVTDDGVLLRFNLREPGEPGLPKVSKADAVKLAYQFVMKVNPDYSLLSDENATVNYGRWSGYDVTFHSLYDGNIVDSNVVRVTVSPEGKVTYYDAFSLARGLNLSETPEEIISADDAKKALKTKLPLELVYRSYYEYDHERGESKATLKLVYQLPRDYSTKVVDAITGEVIAVKRNRDILYAPAPDMAVAETGRAGKTSLSPAEQKAVDVQAGLLTAADVDAKVRAIEEFGLDDSLTIQSSTLYSVKSPFDGKLKYKWSLSYSDADNAKYAYAEVDAETGEILTLGGYGLVHGSYKKPSEFKHTEAECEQAAIKLLEALYGNKFADYVKTEYEGVRPLADMPISEYTFNFVRVVNGAKFYDDMLTVAVDPDTLRIKRINFSYTDTAFPSAEGALDVSAAVDAYFDVVKLEPYYIVGYGVDGGELELPENSFSTEDKVLVPVYGYTYYGYIDAKTGELLSSGGEPAEYKPIAFFDSSAWFKDIAGSPYHKAIALLYNMDIIDTDDLYFRPDDAISAEDFKAMLVNANYSNIESGEQADGETVSLENAIYDIVCAIGYGAIADLNEIFKNPFGDDAKISEHRMGAAAIVKGLNLLDGIDFGDDTAPDLTAPATRGQAAQLIYNLLVREHEKN